MKKLFAILLIIAFFVPQAFAEENLESQVLEIIKKNPQVIKEALEKYEQAAAEKAKEEEFKQLLADRADVKIGESPIHGDKKAKYTIIAFSDFQCPFCKRGDETVKALEKKYPGQIKYVFKNFPLDFHQQARPAAKAVYAAGKQDKFYEYHDKLWENQANLNDETFVKIAEELKLNVDKFNKDRNSEDAEKQVNKDMEDGKAVGIRGTPGFILNGVKILGAYPLDHFEKVISILDAEGKTATKD